MTSAIVAFILQVRKKVLTEFFLNCPDILPLKCFSRICEDDTLFLHMCLWTLFLVDWLEIAACLENAMTFHLYATSSKVFAYDPSGLLPHKNLLKLLRGFLFCAFSRFKWKMNGVQKSGAHFPNKNVFSSQDWSGRSWHGKWELTFPHRQVSHPSYICLFHVYLRQGASREHYHPQLRVPYPSVNRGSVHILLTSDFQSGICAQNSPLGL